MSALTRRCVLVSRTGVWLQATREKDTMRRQLLMLEEKTIKDEETVQDLQLRLNKTAEAVSFSDQVRKLSCAHASECRAYVQGAKNCSERPHARESSCPRLPRKRAHACVRLLIFARLCRCWR